MLIQAAIDTLSATATRVSERYSELLQDRLDSAYLTGEIQARQYNALTSELERLTDRT